MRGAGGAAVAAAAMIERTGLLSGDAAADDARFEASTQQHPGAPEGSSSEPLRAHLFRDVGPAALAAGGDQALMMAFATTMSRGPLTDAENLKAKS